MKKKEKKDKNIDSLKTFKKTTDRSTSEPQNEPHQIDIIKLDPPKLVLKIKTQPLTKPQAQ